MADLQNSEVLFLRAIRSAIHGEAASFEKPLSGQEWQELKTLAAQHRIVPLLAEALYPGDCLSDLPGEWESFRLYARKKTMTQASRTGEFLLLMHDLEARGLHPAVLKGIVCRALYPVPEQRLSNDEDLLIEPSDFPAYHEALLACGLRLREPDKPLENEDEVTYIDPDRDLYLELHLRPFPWDDVRYSFCNAVFEDALSRCVPLSVFGQTIYTLAPTDHLLYLFCHAFKHILYGGVGLRQLSDICLFARYYDAQIDWVRLRSSCVSLNFETFAAAIFRIGEQFFGIPAPAFFVDLQPDEMPLLRDCLTGGLYGTVDLDRAHSSYMTLDAVAADKQGRERRGALSSVFPSVDFFKATFPYLKRWPWLLPVAWVQRIFRYLTREKSSPGRSLQIGRERIELLRQYKLIQ